MLQKPKPVNTMKTPKRTKKRIPSQKNPISDLITIEKQKNAHLDVMFSHSQPNTEIKDEDYFFPLSLLLHLFQTIINAN